MTDVVHLPHLAGVGGPSAPDLCSRVRQVILDRLAPAMAAMDPLADVSALAPGKMLRTTLAQRLAGHDGAEGPAASPLVLGLAAVEMVHTATLCHDDVIDGAIIRRCSPALWRKTSRSAAVLIGDMLLCESIDLVASVAGGRHVRKFVAKVKETCAAEAEQELRLRGSTLDEAACLRIARGKTGALFSFAACLCGRDAPAAAALEEAGYRIGTAYQLADDLLDVVGQDARAGKTLGTDAARDKFTLAQREGGFEITAERVRDLCRSAAALVAAIPAARQGLADFLTLDLEPLLAHAGLDLNLL